MWLNKVVGWPEETGVVPAWRWNNSPKGWVTPEYGGARRKHTHSLNWSLGSEESCWRGTVFKAIGPEDLQLFKGCSCSMQVCRDRHHVPTLPSLSRESQQGFIYFSCFLQQTAVTVVVKYYKERINSAGTINPTYPSSCCVSGQAVSRNDSSGSKGYPGLFSSVITLPAQLLLHLIWMHRTQLSATVCSCLLKLINEWHQMRQNHLLIGLELQQIFVAGYSLAMQVKHQEYR